MLLIPLLLLQNRARKNKRQGYPFFFVFFPSPRFLLAPPRQTCRPPPAHQPGLPACDRGCLNPAGVGGWWGAGGGGGLSSGSLVLQMPTVSTNRPLLLDFHLRSSAAARCRSIQYFIKQRGIGASKTRWSCFCSVELEHDTWLCEKAPRGLALLRWENQTGKVNVGFASAGLGVKVHRYRLALGLTPS